LKGIVSELTEDLPMFVWEMIASRLRDEGWSVWHTLTQDNEDYAVYFQHRGFAGKATGPTLTDAYAAASRRARAMRGSVPAAAVSPYALLAIAR